MGLSSGSSPDGRVGDRPFLSPCFLPSLTGGVGGGSWKGRGTGLFLSPCFLPSLTGGVGGGSWRDGGRAFSVPLLSPLPHGRGWGWVFCGWVLG